MSNKGNIFLLTDSEIAFLKPFKDIVQDILYSFRHIRISNSPNDEAIDMLQRRSDEEFRKQCEERDLNIAKGVKIANKLNKYKWYTIYHAGFIDNLQYENIAGKEDMMLISRFAVITSEDPSKEKTINPDSYPEFYKLEKKSINNPEVWPEIAAQQREALGLSSDYRQIRIDDYEVLTTIIDVFGNEIDTQLVSIPRITAKRIYQFEFPLDKLNSNIWGLTEADTGSILPIGTEKRGKRKEINIMYCINFDALADNVTITKKLDEYDRLVYTAVSALYNSGYKEMSASMIYNVMGYTGRPSADDITKINQSITKMSTAHIFVDNKEEVDNRYKYPRFKYDSSLLPMERIQLIVNGVLADSAIRVFTEPPLMRFSRERGQITTYNVKLLQAPVSKTEQNLRIQFYLLERIARAKSQHGERKILYSTICDRADITAKKQRQRTPEKVKRYMEYFKECGEISGYTSDKESITFSF